MKASAIKLGGSFTLPDRLARVPLDAYQLWAALTRYADFFGLAAPALPTLPVAIELVRGKVGRDLAEAVAAAGSGLSCDDLRMPPVYDGQRYVTAQVSERFIETWYESATVSGCVSRIELGLPVVGGRAAFGGPRVPPLQRPDLPLLGVVDHGFALAGPDFTRAPAAAGAPRTSRVATIWDQDANRPAFGALGAAPPPAFGFGLEADAAMLDALLAARPGAESACYEAAGYAALRHRATHGTQVASLLAGRLAPSHRLRFGAGATATRAADAASQADLALVQLPRAAVEDSSGRWLAVHMLDALHYIVGAAASGQRIVVNVSYGSRVGPHDGTSILECAMVDLLGQLNPTGGPQRLDIALAAGNAFDSRSHAVLALPASGANALRWQVAAGSEASTFAELWFPGGVDPREVEVVLRPPAATGSPALQARGGQVASAIDGHGRLLASILFPIKTPLGLAGSCAVLTVAPTAPRGAGVRAPAGRWTVEIHLHGSAAEGSAGPPAHAYLARNDADFGMPRRGRASHFVAGAGYDGGQRHLRRARDDAVPPQSAVQRHGTLAWNAIAPGLHVVAGHVLRPYAAAAAAHALRRHAPYSSAGPSRDGGRAGPDASMPSDASPVRRGIRGSGTRGDSTMTLVGTSTAVAEHARQLANGQSGQAGPPLPAPPIGQPVRDGGFFGGTLGDPP